MEQPPKHQGSLEKQGRMKTWSWRKYWFVLKEAQLSYVKKQDKVACQGHIDLSQAQIVRPTNGSRGYTFEIITKSRTHSLSAESAEVRSKWLKLIEDSMSWSRTHVFRTGSINSVRASCNSIIEDEDDDYLYSTVSSPGSPSTSSGYSSTGTTSNRASASCRDSGTEDVMYFNSNYSKHDDVVRMVSGDTTPDADNPESGTDANKNVGLRRLNEGKSLPPDSSELPESLTAGGVRDSTMSEMSCIYDEVRDPVANIAISHIVEGYANIARNKGPQPPPATDEEPDTPTTGKTADPEDCLYDEVFDSLNTAKGDNPRGVLMRRSLQLYQVRDSDIENGYAQPADSLLVPQAAATAAPTARVSRSGSTDNKPPVAKKPSAVAKKGPPSIRRSMLPDDILEYFQRPPIPELPHARIELTEYSSFDAIRRFLASNRGPDEVYPPCPASELAGASVAGLKSYLTIIG